MPTVSVPPPYQGPTDGQGEIAVDGSTVRGCLDAVEAKHPGLLELVFDADGKLHRFVKLFVNEEPIGQDDLGAAVAPGDTVSIVAAIGGG